MVVKALTPAAELNPLFHWFFIVVLGIYVPGKHPRLYNVIVWIVWLIGLGSYILYTHMIAQRRKALKKKD